MLVLQQLNLQLLEAIMNKQVIIFFCFNNVEHIKISFDSNYLEDIDYFIVENKSNYSDLIKDYFLERKKQWNNIVGYIQFEKNIVANAINIFIKEYGSFLRNYDYITFTDGDYYSYDIKSTIQEMLMAFNYPDCAMSSVDLYQGNLHTNPNRIAGMKYYDDFMKNRINFKSTNIIGIGVPALMTLQKKDLYILESIYYYDNNIRIKVNQIGKQWYITTKNLLYCLTADICYKGNEYMEWKWSQDREKLWHMTEIANYKILI